MLKSMTWTLMIGLFLSAPAFSQPAGDGTKTQYEKVCQQLKKLKAGPRGAEVKDLVLKRDAATITLSEGQMFLCSDIDGFSCAAVFKGKGNIVFVPPTKVERQQIARFYQNDSINRDFSELFLLCADGTMEELDRKLKFGPLTISEDFGSAADEAVKYITYNSVLKGDYCEPEIMKTILGKQPNGLFYAHIKGPGNQAAEIFELDPYSFEEVEFYKSIKEATLTTYRLDLISKFHWQADSLKTEKEKIRKSLSILNYKMDCLISGEKRMDVVCRLVIKSHHADSRWLNFYLASQWCAGVEADSVSWAGLGPAEFYKGKELDDMWVRSPHPLASGQVCTLTVFYHGDLMERFQNWVYIKSSSGWYPYAGESNRALFDVTYHYPSKFKFISVGDQISSDTVDAIVNSRWVTSTPVQFFTFNMGYFKETKIINDSIPPVTILTSDEIRMDEKQVGADVANSLAFFQKVYGECPASRLCAAQYPFGGGVAFPGLINLAWYSFKNNLYNKYQSYQEVLRSHEVAHQWLGYGVSHDSYHDQWLSEGLSEFSGLWYMQNALKDNENYFKWFKEYRDDIINNRKYLLGDGKGSGPIWLGRRNITSETFEDNAVITYKKGAWVIQMLRNMLIDLNTMKEDKFIGMMRDYYATYRDSLVSTEQFRKIAEKHLWMDMGWFFDQWVYGTDIPNYKYCYTTSKTPDGKFRVTLKVRQEEVSPDFMMYIPLLVDFGEKRQARLRVLVKGPLTELELPLMPLKPKDIEFNPYQSVLCRQDKESF
ncbi:hypothetical protein HZA73_11150 [candidate division TA06 bacterium]|nr:hypothetical protein [candidate division TA06 bacterium]